MARQMNVLGIESTAHTFGIGHFNGEQVIHFNDTFVPPKGQGFLPRDLGSHHSEVAPILFDKFLNKIDMEKVNAIAYSKGPGIGQALQVGTVFARYLHLKYGLPVYGINHCMAHLEIARYENTKNDHLSNPLFVYVSGGNTQIISREIIKGRVCYRVMGETLDMGLGNAFDVFSREIGVSNGAELEKIALGNYIDLPYSVKGMNLNFSGLLTASCKALDKNSKNDVAYTFMHNAFAMVSEAVERALCLSSKDSIVVVGGVAKNKMFKHMISTIASEHNVSFISPMDEYNGDNAGMIAYAGSLVCKKNKPLKLSEIVLDPYWRIDDVCW